METHFLFEGLPQQVGNALMIKDGGQTHIAIVKSDHLKTRLSQSVDQRLWPRYELQPKPHDQ